MLQLDIEKHIEHAVEQTVIAGLLHDSLLSIPIDLQPSASNIEYDYTTTFCMRAAKISGTDSYGVFHAINQTKGFAGLEEQGLTFIWSKPGFLNVKVDTTLLQHATQSALGGETISSTKQPESYSVEYVSVNPNGPITVAAARGAAIGDVLSRVLTMIGHNVTREYYINDGVNSEQMRLFSESVKHHVFNLLGMSYDMPENGYKGEYVEGIASVLVSMYDAAHLINADTNWYQSTSQQMMIDNQKQELAQFGVEFDMWVSEQAMIESGKVGVTLQHLQDSGQSAKIDGATWLLTKQYGDSDDRVLVRSDGRMTYAASDISYHHDKYARGNQHVVDLFGPDHHGYIPRLKAGVAALGHNPESLNVVIFQAVRFIKEGQPVLMRKRDGNLYTLVDLINEVAQELGSDFDTAKDVVRFFYLYVSASKHMDFDIGLAVKQAQDNPCFYVKYAHARCASILAKAPSQHVEFDWNHKLTIQENKLIVKCLSLNDEVHKCAETCSVHQLAHFAVELSKMFHEFYENCKVIQENEPEQTYARLQIVQLTKQTLSLVGGILGVSMPDSM
jgi:arginyl-tRNA synthetase